MITPAVTRRVFNSSLYAIAACSLGPIESMVRLTDQVREGRSGGGEGGHSDAHRQISIGLFLLIGEPGLGDESSHSLCDLSGLFLPGLNPVRPRSFGSL